ncbi:hypothetical protein L873DRAFT_1827514 [Choiromyces venosus 120613-1]|uniref:DNA mismatch repair proteins mutS family domain-containing protein n=1 Tax=Choiromyces venosus 120613-1 TaxID=1336337 RepID=A0A3N4JRC1_9PEZI|nr:hypothetical protein L873DRAFT_1827514 [Choiromyces venosus 120613-1]
MRKFPHCVLLTRVGGFYEMYFEAAEEYGPLLGLKVAQKKTSAGSVSMAGFPFPTLDRFLKVLVQDHGKFVAVSEEYPNPEKGGLLFDRKITRVVTPGTLIDENFMDPSESHYLLAVIMGPGTGSEREVGLAWLDLSTGDFFTQETAMGGVRADVARIGPKEVVLLGAGYSGASESGLEEILRREQYFVTIHTVDTKVILRGVKSWKDMIETEISKTTIKEMKDIEVQAANILLDYTQTRLPGIAMRLQPPVRKTMRDSMIIDSYTLRGLEITKTSRDQTLKGALLDTIKKTTTLSGSRLLTNWIKSPITSITAIEHRLNLVETFKNDTYLREDIQSLLKRTYDSQRLLQKMSLARGGARDLVRLARTIQTTQKILERLKSENLIHAASVEQLVEGVDTPLNLAKLILDSIDEEGLLEKIRMEESEEEIAAALAEADGEIAAADYIDPAAAVVTPIAPSSTSKKAKKVPSVGKKMLSEKDAERAEAWIMQKSASSSLTRLHKKLDELEWKRVNLETELARKISCAQSLTLRWTPRVGHICHVKGKDVDLNHIAGATRVSSSKSTLSLQLPEWTELGIRIDGIRTQIRTEEQVVLQRLRAGVMKSLSALRKSASVLDRIDIACSFAMLARERNHVRPLLNLGVSHKIVAGRHPTVENGLHGQGRKFTPNDCFVGDRERLWVITGPNMAGKSTFLRQNALISILAQVGSFVPAEVAEIGIVDRIFSRVGSADNLFKDQSTFMVEMLETAEILKSATPRSFVIMDEVGRGTTPKDGLAVAHACLHHLYHTNQCRVLFATHFHDLTDLAKSFEGVGFYCTDIIEDGESFSFDHRVRPGVNRNSHALKVARLAGIPDGVIEVAEETLKRLDDGGS